MGSKKLKVNKASTALKRLSQEPAPSQARLKQLFHYDPETGVFTRLTTQARNAPAGSVVGFLSRVGYLTVGISGKNYYLHRLAWVYVYGEPPPEGMVVDHIDRNPLNNAITNLRLVDRRENYLNSAHMDSISGEAAGATFQYGRWVGQISYKGRHYYLGVFATKAEACAAYNQKLIELESDQ